MARVDTIIQCVQTRNIASIAKVITPDDDALFAPPAHITRQLVPDGMGRSVEKELHSMAMTGIVSPAPK